MSIYPGSLHNHTDYSNLRLRDCIIKYNELIDYAVELGHKGVAITDHEAISSAVKVEEYAKKIREKNPDFKVVRGNEIYLCRNGLRKENYVPGVDKFYHFILLAKDAIGHEQLRKLSTRAWLRAFEVRRMERVPTYYQDLFDVIGANKGHLIASSACLGGALPTQILKQKDLNDPTLAKNIRLWVQQMVLLFGQGNFYLELQPSASKEQSYVNKELVKLSKELNVPYIITTDSHYLKKKDAPIHKAFLNAQEGEREVDSFYATTYLMDDEELRSYIEKDLSQEEIEEAYRNIQGIFDKCENYSILKPLKIPRLPWVDEPTSYNEELVDKIPQMKIFLGSDYDGDRILAKVLMNAIEKDPYCNTEEAYNEINACLEMTWVSSQVNKAYWSAYFLNLQRIIKECWEAGTLLGAGRGSGVGFILLYLLGITQINPLRETTKLYRWRFLNPERVSVLDVDVDIEGTKRTQVLRHLREVYGEDRVANVATFGTEKPKSAILTSCRGLGLPPEVGQYLASMVTADRGILRTLKQTFYGDEEEGIAPNKTFVKEMTENYPEVWEVAQKIEGLICRLGEHAGGVIFVDEPFTKSTALMRAPNGDIITQFDLHDAEKVS